jgi:hypothetical protein
LAERVAAFRIVIVNGPRQGGKTTLLRQFLEERSGSFRSLDDASTLAVARDDPTGFARYGAPPRIVDEVQRGGDPLVLAIKHVVDTTNDRGQFILSGSTRFLTVPTLSESLSGRAVFVDLWPLTAAERFGAPGDFCDQLFAGREAFTNAESSPWTRRDYLDLAIAGGYPEALGLPTSNLRQGWFDGYLNTVILRDVQSFAHVQHVEVIPRLLAMVAARAGSLTALSSLANGLEVSHATVRNYLTYLDTVFLVGRLPPWSLRISARHVKSPKHYPTDSGLAAHLLQVDEETAAAPGDPKAATLVETFVFAELTRLLAASDIGASLYFYRDGNGREIDFLLERRDGRVAAVEVKTASTVGPKDFRHLRWLREALGDRFAGGYVLYLGDATHPVADGMLALPLSAMWHHRR